MNLAPLKPQLTDLHFLAVDQVAIAAPHLIPRVIA
jgi:hypothetical protein